MDWGIKNRLSRVISPKTGKTVMLAVDHGYFQGPTTGLKKPKEMIEPLLPYADCLFITRGILRNCINTDINTPIFLRVSGGPSVLGELSNEDITTSMKEAIRLNAAGVGMSIFVGAKNEDRTISNLGRLVNEAEEYGIPVLAITAVGKEMARDARYLGLASRIAAEGIALDIAETAPLVDSDVSIIGTNDYKKTKNSDIIVITAGSQRKAGMSRDDLLGVNAKIVKNIVKNIVRYSKKCIIIAVTNPLDAITYVALKESKFKKNKVMGMAGVLDSSRFRSFVAKELKVGVEDIDALVLGGHGDSMIPLKGHANVNGVPLTELMNKAKLEKIVKRTRNAGAEIINLEKSSAYYSAGTSVSVMIESIVKNKRRILPCAAYLNGEYGVKGIIMGVPVVLGINGIEKIVELKLSKDEKNKFMKSAAHVKKLIEKVKRL